MKFLDISDFDQINLVLNSIENFESKLHAKLEGFSIKLAGDDKQLYHNLNRSYENIAKSPTGNMFQNPFGSLADSASRKVLISIVTTLSHTFPDYDFREVRASDFKKEPNFAHVFNTVHSTLSSSFPKYNESGISGTMWEDIHKHIKFDECDIYRYVPSDSELDPYGEGLWSFHFIFYNKKLKRVLLFSCCAMLKQADDDDEMQDSNDYFDME